MLWVALFAVVVGVSVTVSALTTSEGERIEGSNEAAESNAQTDTGLYGEISAFDLRKGDCYNNISSSIGDFERVTRVKCEGAWEARILDTILLSHAEGALYPGLEYMDNVYQTQCSMGATMYHHPTEVSWERGDRVISCVMEK